MRETMTVRIPEKLRKRVAVKAKAEGRTISSAVENYIRLAMIAEENPDLSFSND